MKGSITHVLLYYSSCVGWVKGSRSAVYCTCRMGGYIKGSHSAIIIIVHIAWVDQRSAQSLYGRAVLYLSLHTVVLCCCAAHRAVLCCCAAHRAVLCCCGAVCTVKAPYTIVHYGKYCTGGRGRCLGGNEVHPALGAGAVDWTGLDCTVHVRVLRPILIQQLSILET